MKNAIKLLPAVFAVAVLGACSNDSRRNTAVQDSIVTDSSAVVKAAPAAADTALGKPDEGDSDMQKAVAIWYKYHDKTSYATAIYTVRGTLDNQALTAASLPLR